MFHVYVDLDQELRTAICVPSDLDQEIQSTIRVYADVDRICTLRYTCNTIHKLSVSMAIRHITIQYMNYNTQITIQYMNYNTHITIQYIQHNTYITIHGIAAVVR